MSQKDFRAELVKIMPGYSWTVHKPISDTAAPVLTATGTMSSGSNRLSTLAVQRTDRGGGNIWYEAKSAGYGLHAAWLMKNGDGTLARALRGLQKAYENNAATYRTHAAALEQGRKAKGGAA